MIKLLSLQRRKHTLRRKLFGYMFILAVLLLMLLFVGVFLVGGFTNTKQQIINTLEFQTKVFEQQLTTHYDDLAVMSVQLSNKSTDIIDEYLDDYNISFNDINNSEKHIKSLQENLIVPLQNKLWEADCTGAFIMLDAQVNTSVENSEFSRTGLYLQRNSIDANDTRVLLYRGLSEVGKKHKCMPHRKWRLEFSTDIFPNYSELINEASLPLKTSYRITDVVILPGTDQHVMLMTVPIMDSKGNIYGLCGLEINESYFKDTFAQPSELNRAIFCLSKGSGGLKNSQDTLSCGVTNEYYLEPKGTFSSEEYGKELTTFSNENASYVGITKDVNLCPGNCVSSISVLMIMDDYNNIAAKDLIRAISLILIFIVIAGSLAMFFAHRYLKPIKKDIEQIRQKEYSEHNANVSEIDDLFVFLSEQDSLNENAIAQAEKEKAEALATIEKIKSKYDEANKQVERLAYSRKDEVDPYDYEVFLDGLKHLTDREKEIFNLYLSGKKVKEIVEITGVKESTIRYHNKNIYSKLGVHSLKQLLRFATIMKQEEANTN